MKIYKNRFRSRCFTFDGTIRALSGDEHGSIDHFRTARYGEPYIKQFAGERDFDVVFAMDASSSQMFGSTVAKVDFAMKLANELSSIARKVGDRTGMVMFSESVDFYKPVRTGLHIPVPGNHKFGVKSNPNVAVKFLQNALKASSIVFFISDFLYPDRIRDDLIGSLRVLAKRHDLICVRLCDRADAALPAIGRLRLQDSESLNCLYCDSSSSRFSSMYGNIYAKWANKLHEDAARVGLKFIAIDNGCAIELAMEKCLDKQLACA